jgi:hypothetical protein
MSSNSLNVTRWFSSYYCADLDCLPFYASSEDNKGSFESLKVSRNLEHTTSLLSLNARSAKRPLLQTGMGRFVG